MFGFRFLGNTRIPHNKNTNDLAPVRITPPAEVLLPVDQHIGAPAVPVVKVGDEVKVGQLVAKASGYISANIHSSVSGKVTKIDDCLKFSGRTVPAIRIENDGLMTPYEDIKAPEITDIDSFVNAIADSGIVGLGGAGFPTSVKFDAIKKGGIHTIIVNAAECEPYITSDARTMLDHPDLVFEGISLIQRIAPTVKRYIIGIEKNKPTCIANMTEIFAGDDSVKVVSLPTLYPQGAEKTITHNTTGLVVPEGKLPSDIGVLVVNVSTVAQIASYAKTGMPLVERCVTVDGSAISTPANVIVPIGTSINDVLEFVGGTSGNVGKVIMGGPMTGRTAYSLSEPIIKTSNAIVVLTEKESRGLKVSDCIHCGKCIDACPNHLNPTGFTKALSIEDMDERMSKLEELSVTMCMECGCCAFVCPANRPLINNIRLSKNSLREYKAHKATLK